MSDFAARFEELLTGFTVRDPLIVRPETYRELLAEPSIAHLMSRVAMSAADRVTLTGCIGKSAFSDKRRAVSVIAKMRRAHGHKNGRGRPEPYRCTACGKWHIGGRS